jgi:hypothetical protein
MKCDCLNRIEEKMLTTFNTDKRYKKTVEHVEIDRALVFGSNLATRTFTEAIIKLEGEMKNRKENLMHTYCPWCGTPEQEDIIAKPTVVCLCGSTRFYKEFIKANYDETMKGNIVLSVGFYPHASEEVHGQNIGITDEQKKLLDELHKRKIDLSDEILVLNVGEYIGNSTKSEIEYAEALKKGIRYLEPR